MVASFKEMREALLKGVTRTEGQATSFFKTAPGSYAEHDKFIGVAVPYIRHLAKIFLQSSLPVLKELLASPINEERLLALFIMVHRYQKAGFEGRQELYQFYLDNISQVNNWNLVDSSAHLIVGAHIWKKESLILETLACSNSLWERRIAIVATWYFIRKGDFSLTFKIAQLLLHDGHDLIHKAVGWMLRETGKRDEKALISFLEVHAYTMPRAMLRCAVEKLVKAQRHRLLAKDEPRARH